MGKCHGYTRMLQILHVLSFVFPQISSHLIIVSFLLKCVLIKINSYQLFFITEES